jgi:DNA polymerase-1
MELRMVAHLTEDPVMLEAYDKDGDLHKTTQERLQCERIRAKTVNFGLMYGTQPPKLALMLECSESEASVYSDLFFETYSNIKPYTRALCRQAARDGYIRLLSGFKRRLPDLNSSDRWLRMRAERQCWNAEVQGNCAYVMKHALTKIEKSTALKKYGARLLLTVHDEVVLEVPQMYAAHAAFLTKQLMEDHPYNLLVPLDVDVEIGSSWGKAKP